MVSVPPVSFVRVRFELSSVPLTKVAIAEAAVPFDVIVTVFDPLVKVIEVFEAGGLANVPMTLAALAFVVAVTVFAPAVTVIVGVV
jgi:hypothetical protein